MNILVTELLTENGLPGLPDTDFDVPNQDLSLEESANLFGPRIGIACVGVDLCQRTTEESSRCGDKSAERQSEEGQARLKLAQTFGNASVMLDPIDRYLLVARSDKRAPACNAAPEKPTGDRRNSDVAKDEKDQTRRCAPVAGVVEGAYSDPDQALLMEISRLYLTIDRRYAMALPQDAPSAAPWDIHAVADLRVNSTRESEAIYNADSGAAERVPHQSYISIVIDRLKRWTQSIKDAFGI